MPTAKNTIRSLVKNTVQGVVSPLGYRVVKWPESSVATEAAAGGVAKHFPVGTPRPWHVPADLRGRSEVWCRTLVKTYDDHTSWPASIVPEGGMLLHALVRNIQPTRIIETGTCLGVSTVWMAAALAAMGNPHAKVFTYDDYRDPPDERLAASKLFQNRLEGVRARFTEAGVADRIEIRVGDCTKLVERDRAEHLAGGGVQFAFIDADHSPHGATADFRAIEPVLAVGGYVLLHDVYPEIANHLGPRYVIENLGTIATGKYEVCDLYLAQTNYGMTLLRRVG